METTSPSIDQPVAAALQEAAEVGTYGSLITRFFVIGRNRLIIIPPFFCEKKLGSGTFPRTRETIF